MKEVMNILNCFSYNSVVILSYFFLCFFFLLLNHFTKGKANQFFVMRKGSIINPMNYIRLLTSGLCHKDWNHFRNNFITILLIGPMLEEKYGSIPLLQMLVLTTLISSAVHLVIYKHGAVGASDNVFMLIVLCSIVNITDGKIPITLVFIFFFYVADEIIKQFSKKNDHVAHDSHIVGALLGFLYGYFLF